MFPKLTADKYFSIVYNKSPFSEQLRITIMFKQSKFFAKTQNRHANTLLKQYKNLLTPQQVQTTSTLNFKDHPYMAVLFFITVLQFKGISGRNNKVDTKSSQLQNSLVCPVEPDTTSWLTLVELFQNMLNHNNGSLNKVPTKLEQKKKQSNKEKKNKKNIVQKKLKKENIEALLKKIEIKRCTANTESVLSSASYVAISPRQEKLIREALLVIAPQEKILQGLIEGRLKIHILKEELMKEYTGMENYSAAYISSPFNTIVLNEHIFANGKDEEIRQQLITLLANEISHATIYFIKTNDPNFSVDKESGVDLAPWNDDEGRKKFEYAFELFLDRVNEYERLSEMKNLNNKEKVVLEKNDEALKNYITPRLGSKRHNAMQVHIREKGLVNKQGTLLERYTNVDKKRPKFLLLQDFDNVISPSAKVEEVIKYKRENLFKETEMKRIHYRYLKTGLYENHEWSLVCADLLSDFETLPSEATKYFGPELCKYLDEFTKITGYCEKPFSNN